MSVDIWHNIKKKKKKKKKKKRKEKKRKKEGGLATSLAGLGGGWFGHPYCL
jgi:uncharacterized membrane protein YfcA